MNLNAFPVLNALVLFTSVMVCPIVQINLMNSVEKDQEILLAQSQSYRKLNGYVIMSVKENGVKDNLNLF